VARRESDREDLLEEATGLNPCWEFRLHNETVPTVAGFRKNGNLTIYLREGTMFHFDTGGRLRRAYVAGELYRSEGRTISRLRRERTTDSTTLLRKDLGDAELRDWLEREWKILVELLERLENGEYLLLRKRGAESDGIGRLLATLKSIVQSPPRISAPLR
jgi:hypothetical protein